MPETPSCLPHDQTLWLASEVAAVGGGILWQHTTGPHFLPKDFWKGQVTNPLDTCQVRAGTSQQEAANGTNWRHTNHLGTGRRSDPRCPAGPHAADTSGWLAEISVRHCELCLCAHVWRDPAHGYVPGTHGVRCNIICSTAMPMTVEYTVSRVPTKRCVFCWFLTSWSQDYFIFLKITENREHLGPFSPAYVIKFGSNKLLF